MEAPDSSVYSLKKLSTQSSLTQSSTHVSGLHASSKAWYISELFRNCQKILVLCSDDKVMRELYQDLVFFIGSENLNCLPSWDCLPFEIVSPQTDVSAERLAAIYKLQSATSGIVLATAAAFLQKTVTKDFFSSLIFHLHKNDPWSSETLQARFIQSGYNAVSLVEDLGEVAFHGHVVDFFPPLSEFPVRLELQNGTLSSLRHFDPDSQRSTTDFDSIEVLPVREYLPIKKLHGEVAIFEKAIERLKTRGRELETPAREIAAAMINLRSGEFFPACELLHATTNDLLSLTDLIATDTKIVVNDRIAVEQSFEQSFEQIESRYNRLASEHFLIPRRQDLFSSPLEAEAKLIEKTPIILDHLEIGQESDSATSAAAIKVTANTVLKTRLKGKVGSGEALTVLKSELNRLRGLGVSVAFAVGSAARAERLRSSLLELGFDSHRYENTASRWVANRLRFPLSIIEGALQAGFLLNEERLCFIAEHEIYPERSTRKGKQKRTNLRRLMGSLSQLHEGDYLVHIDYGVGLYKGLVHLDVEGSEGDFLQLQYADSTLYLPVHFINKIQKFSAAEGQLPSLDKLSNQTRWQKTKAKIREDVMKLAGELINLYAARSVSKGWRFEPLGAEDERFAEDFPYQETPDQLKAIEETIADMAKDKPMDRLVCGDVGFGKTEVAMRAAFKCHQHGRQTAVLAPTTILVEQHRQSFLKRFQGTTAKIGAVSRFYPAQENRKTLEAVARGEIDIVIGTHRLLSADVSFADLGLLIIDEEHRFGVRQKEKLKSIKKQVDVLTLTATPIPRTLHMSLLDIRDISVINSPPVDRRSVRTYVARYDEQLIRDALLRELQRGGQAFFVHNRVESIVGVTHSLTELVPEARFEFAHGQMGEEVLEEIMERFLSRQIDVLVCTTIIESGIDIPSANTIIIDRADALGLAQLYQLRGRVGRSTTQAYAYLLIPKTSRLTQEAQSRLKVLQSLDDLGLGFNLAIRDLEIRGAGNMLGKEQSGSVLAVGFEMYTKILSEAVAEMRGEELDFRESVEPEIKIGLSAFIDEHYVPDLGERLSLYQRLGAVTTDTQLYDLRAEIEDRYGPLPGEALCYVELMDLRLLLKENGITKLDFSKGRITIIFSSQTPVDGAKAVEMMQKNPERYKFGKNQSLIIKLPKETIASPQELHPPLEAVFSTIIKKSAR